MKFHSFLAAVVILLVAANTSWAKISEQKAKEVLQFTKDFLDKESKNSGIFKLQRPDKDEEQWFELYGILGDVREYQDKFIVTVDVDLFGYKDRNYLLYFVVKETEGQYNLDEIQIGPRFTREKTEKISIPE